ncbi:hypothetical protein QE152_g13190 [Popillia japonica]|uniref:Uncharacterized protein n=1 Tax=Popillia japonica TaxID=7064 RepID=A0AAW1LAQ1_POPJA
MDNLIKLVGVKRKLESELCILKYYNRKIKDKIKQLERGTVTGGQLQSTSRPQPQQVIWDDIKSAFNRRIQSGVIINLHHTGVIN